MAIKQLRLFLSLAALITWISAQAQTIEPVDSKDLTLKNYLHVVDRQRWGLRGGAHPPRYVEYLHQQRWHSGYHMRVG